MSNLEIAATLLGLANIILIVRRSLWNYPFGIAMVALYAVIFYDAKLYSDALLQIFFFVVQFYGLWCWFNARDAQGDLVVVRAGMPVMLRWAMVLSVATLIWGWLMHRFTDAAFPWWDAAVAMISVGAQIMMSRRYIENWAAWVLVDALAIGLYASRGLTLSAALYALFLALALWGWREWLVTGRNQQLSATEPAAA